MSPDLRQPGSPEHDWRPTAPVGVLRRRAALVDRARTFFRERGVLEVDTPVLQGGANLDHGVTPMCLDVGGLSRFLPTSPEHPLKRLIAAGSGDVWTLAPAFRAGECGQRHAPEFRMLEWYRLGWDDRQLATEVLALLSTLTGWSDAHEVMTWRDAFRTHAGIDPLTAKDAALFARLGTDASVANNDRRIALDVLLTRDVEPQLGRGRWTVLTDYPADQCAQARIRQSTDGTAVAARFELYRDGIELANGYHELLDGRALRERLEQELATRNSGEQLDVHFLAAMAEGLPDCAGVAVGFDRVVMLALGLPNVAATQAFAWGDA
ncbi:MAG TPA: EF-P lysine aminoacylase EpmA [Planctomycetota bacterium]|nr:EF-P lysine aminoacylase EpmA [Planctomycetota bacterium]